MVPAVPGIVTKSILTTGDSVGGYRMAGIPDGLGAYDNGDGTFTVLMNHELPSNRGIVRAHGGMGAFVSKWTIDKDSLEVTHGEDLIKRVFRWNATTSAWELIPAGSPELNIGRLCSADLAEGGQPLGRVTRALPLHSLHQRPVGAEQVHVLERGALVKHVMRGKVVVHCVANPSCSGST